MDRFFSLNAKGAEVSQKAQKASKDFFAGFCAIFATFAFKTIQNDPNIVPSAITTLSAMSGITMVIAAMFRYDCLCVSLQIDSSVMMAPQCGSESNTPADITATRCSKSGLMPA